MYTYLQQHNIKETLHNSTVVHYDIMHLLFNIDLNILMNYNIS